VIAAVIAAVRSHCSSAAPGVCILLLDDLFYIIKRLH
jgi:hypothetical protein